MGNTAEMILTQIDCSVLAIKPEGFVSPVTLES
jgi:nucleotide-binding universal stress UspA family protein